MTTEQSIVKFKSFGAAALALPFLLVPECALAEDFTAGVVMRDWTDQQRSMFFTGLIEGLAYARYVADGKDTAGMACIYDWFYGDAENSILQIYGAFATHSDAVPASVVAALINKECGT